ncbi:hypothetical protein [Luteolibacter marinus]|uniref:hypothetical protein n=1 Tax=Luteolibacter marinus TaxID=2776705 RepID=UPI0018681F0F|nr:hypothetical protein [Luteolibacter marinus]
MRTLALALLCLLALPLAAETAPDLRGLVREKASLERRIIKLFSEKGLHRNEEYRMASAAAAQASREFSAARKDHPQVKPLLKKSAEAQALMMKAQREGDAEARKAAMKEFTQVRIEVEKASAGIPELEESRKKAQAANEASEKVRRRLLGETEDGKKLLAELEALDVRVKAAREAAGK